MKTHKIEKSVIVEEEILFFGDSINHSEQEGIICNCGSKEFKMIFHMNMNPIFSEASPTSIPKE